MTIEYLKCRADLSFEVDFGITGAIGVLLGLCSMIKCDHILFGQWIVFIHNIIFFNTLHLPLIMTDHMIMYKKIHSFIELQIKLQGLIRDLCFYKRLTRFS